MAIKLEDIAVKANLPEFAAITGGLIVSEYLDEPMTAWGFNEDTKALARILGGEAITYAMNQLTPEYSPYVKHMKALSYVPTAIAADGAARWIKPKIGLKTGAPQRVVIREPAQQRQIVHSAPAPMPSPAPVHQVVKPPIKVGASLNEAELKSLGFGLA